MHRFEANAFFKTQSQGLLATEALVARCPDNFNLFMKTSDAGAPDALFRARLRVSSYGEFNVNSHAYRCASYRRDAGHSS
jgi:hypothetical protein